jgi:hypothetical protein
MGQGIGRRPEISVNDIPAKVHDYHFLRRKILIGNPAGFDRKYTQFPVYHADVAKGENDQPEFGELHIGLVSGLLYELIFFHILLLSADRWIMLPG